MDCLSRRGVSTLKKSFCSSVGNADASQLEGSGLDSSLGRCVQYIPYWLMAKGPFFMDFVCSPCVPQGRYPHKRKEGEKKKV